MPFTGESPLIEVGFLFESKISFEKKLHFI